MTDSELLVHFFSETLGAVGAFLLHIFTEVNLFGISIIELLFMLLVVWALFWLFKLLF